LFSVAVDQNDFYTSIDEELEPMVSNAPAVFLAGAAHGPKDIPETVAQASGAASKVISLFQEKGRVT
jgi:heterodisulfide reductase subunit A